MKNHMIIYHVTKQYMKKNARRTAISLIGIILMVVMMTCVFIGKDTALGYLTQLAETNHGKWHVAAYDVRPEALEDMKALPYISETALSEQHGYSYFHESNKENRPFLKIRHYSPKMFDWMNITVVEGKLPSQANEVVLSNATRIDGADIQIGDTIDVATFRRYITNTSDSELVFPFLELILKPGEEQEAPDTFPYTKTDANLVDIKERHEETGFAQQYTVTGFIEAPFYEGSENVAYTAIGYMDEQTISSKSITVSAFIDRSKFLGDITTEIQETTQSQQVELNSPVLIYSGNGSDNTIVFISIMMQLFFVLLICVISIILIYNIFNLSYEERCRYLGMLSSIGATAKQKRSSVYYEAGLLLAIALPIGFLLGLGITYVGMEMVEPIAVAVSQINTPHTIAVVPPHIELQPISIAYVVIASMTTVFVSAFLPARKMSKIGPIASIRGVDQVPSHKKIKSSSSIWKSAEGALATGFLRYQRKKVKSVIYALAGFLIMLTVVIYGSQSLIQMVRYKLMDQVTYTSRQLDQGEYGLTDLGTTDYEESTIAIEPLLSELEQTKGITNVKIMYAQTWVGQTNPEVYSQEYWDTFYQVMALYHPDGWSRSDFEREFADNSGNFVNMMTFDETTFNEIVAAVGGNHDFTGEHPVIVFQTGELSTEKNGIFGVEPREYRFYELSKITDLAVGDTLPFKMMPNEQGIQPEMELTIVGFANKENVKKWLTIHDSSIWVIAKNHTAQAINAIRPKNLSVMATFDADENIPEAASKIDQLFANQSVRLFKNEQNVLGKFPLMIQQVISVITQGFIVISSTICLLNVFNSISGLMVARRKEFAMLRSYGMTKRQLLHMCRIECGKIVLRSLILAIPISALICWLIQVLIIGRFGRFTIEYPVVPVLAIIISTIIIVFLLSHYCCVRENRANIIEEIRRESI